MRQKRLKYSYSTTEQRGAAIRTFDRAKAGKRYCFTQVQLLALKSELEYVLAGEVSQMKEQDIDKFYERFQAILEETNEYWRDLRREESSIGSA